MPPDREDNYDDSPTPPPAATKEAGAPKDGGDDDDGGKTSILPRSFFGGKDLKPGDKCEVTVSAVHENDVEVTPCDSGDDESEEQPPDEEGGDQPPDAAAAPMPGSMASMMQ